MRCGTEAAAAQDCVALCPLGLCAQLLLKPQLPCLQVLCRNSGSSLGYGETLHT